MNTFSIRLLALDTKGKPLNNHRIELWDFDPRKDDFIGEAITDNEGLCAFRFDERHYGDYGGKPDLYFKIFKGDELLSNTRGVTVFNLDIPNALITLRIGADVKVESTRKADQIPFAVGDLNETPEKLGEASSGYVTQKLNEALLNILLSRFTNASAEVKESIGQVSLSYAQWADKNVGEVAQAVLSELKCDAAVQKYLTDQNVQESLQSDKQPVRDLLHLDQPLVKNPYFYQESRILQTTDLLTAFDFSNDVAEQLLDTDTDWERATPRQWAEMEEKKKLTSEQVSQLKRSFALSRFTGKQTKLAKVVSEKITDLKHLARLEVSDWLTHIKVAGNELPKGETPESYAQNLVRLAERNFPTEFFMERKVRRDLPTDELLKELNELQKPGSPVPKSKQKSTSGAEKLSFEEMPNLRGVANTYRHLGAEELLTDPNMAPQTKIAELAKMKSQLQRFEENNATTDLLHTNYFKKNEAGERAFNFSGIPADQQDGVRKTMMAFQRVAGLSKDFLVREVLLSEGFDASASIVNADAGVLEAKLGSKLSISQYNDLIKNAQSQFETNVHTTMAIRGIDTSRFVGFSVENYPPALVNQLQDIDGYSDMFGSQDYCECDHCKSIFSPAAYFVDLMRFVEKNVHLWTLNNGFPFDPVPPASTHPIALKTRRPDLWSLELSCQNTNEVLPYLQVVNEIKERYTNQVMAGIRGQTIAATNVWKELSLLPLPGGGGSGGTGFRLGAPTIGSTWKNGFRVAFNRPFEESQIMLEAMGLRYLEVLQGLNVTDNERMAEAYLGASYEEFQVLTTGDANLNDLRALRFGFPPDSADFELLACPPAVFMRSTNLSRTEMDFLLSSKSHLHTVSTAVRLVRIPVPDDVQAFTEKIEGLESVVVLDYIHRFVRLKRLTGWTIEELDLAVQTIGSFTKSTIEEIARMCEIRRNFNVSVEESIALCKEITNTSINKRQIRNEFLNVSEEEPVPGMLERLFDKNYIVIPQNGTDSLDPDSLISNGKLPYFLKGIGATEAEFRLIFNTVLDLPSEQKLNIKNVSQVYRLVRLARLFHLSVEDLLFLLGPIYNTVSGRILSLQKTVERLRNLPLSLSDIKLIKDNTVLNTLDTANETAVNTWLSGLLTDERLYLTKDVLKDYLPAEKQAAYIDLLATALINNGIIVAMPEPDLRFRVVKLNTVTLADVPDYFSAGITDTEALAKLLALRQKLVDDLNARFNLVLEHLGQQCKAKTELVPPMFDWYPDAWAVLGLLESQLTKTDGSTLPALPLPLANLFKNLERLALLFNKMGFTVADLAWLNIEANFGKFVSGASTTNYLTRLNTFEEFFRLGDYKRFKTLAGPLPEDADAYHAALLAERLDWFGAHAALLSKVLDCEQGQLQALELFVPGAALSTFPTDKLLKLEQNVSIAQQLGIWTDSVLNALKDNKYDTALVYEPVLHSAFRSRYKSNEDYEKAWKPIEEKINELRRDVLCSYLLALDQQNNFSDTGDLYAYFLVDVEMSGCAEVSRILAANLTLQTYVHRVLMGLEITKEPKNKLTDPPQVLAFLGNPGVDNDEKNMRAQWEWRKNYRIWEANRKVFLYPENWIEPELRDDKSPLFRTLEDELLQQKISLESAEGAYKEYLKGFAEVGQLAVVGAVYNESAEIPMHFIFGRTASDPYIYYFRKMTMIGSGTIDVAYDWKAWEKIDLAISAPEVTPLIYQNQLYLFWVEIQSQENSSFSNGGSQFDGTQHKVNLLYSSLNSSGKWLQPQRLDFHEYEDKMNNYSKYREEVFDTMKDGVIFSTNGYERKYKTRDFFFKSRLYKKLYVTFDKNDRNIIRLNYHREWLSIDNNTRTQEIGRVLNLFDKKLTNGYRDWVFKDFLKVLPFGSSTRVSHYTHSPEEEFVFDYNHNKLGIGVTTKDLYEIDGGSYKNCYFVNRSFKHGANFVPNDLIIQLVDEYLLLHKKYTNQQNYKSALIKLNTSAVRKLQEILFVEKLDGFLSIKTQTIHDKQIPAIVFNASEMEIPPSSKLNFSGSCGLYFKELFFHIPFLIADHLNAEGKYKDADYWYRKIFDPAAPIDGFSLMKGDRYWQYMEFRGHTMPKLKEILNNAAAIATYENAPFNPHAIARLRLSAYMKSIVMKYVDNLLDWADSLFRQYTWEANTEALMLYRLAHDILGPRPQKLGKCESAIETENCGCAEPVTYSSLIKSEVSPFLYYVDNLVMTPADTFDDAIPLEDGNGTVLTDVDLSGTVGIGFEEFTIQNNSSAGFREAGAPPIMGRVGQNPTTSIGRDMFLRGKKSLVFCIPNNEKMLDYWDRVDDRLYKLHHCLNIDGVRQSLALFEAPIDPALLVLARAGGLDLADVLSGLYAPPPAYRFTYLLEKARAFTGTVQGFGGALLSALEKKDGEELTLLRSTHEQNLLKMTKEIKKKAVQEAQANLEATVEGMMNTMNRVVQYTLWIEENLNGWERTQQIALHATTIIKGSEVILSTISSMVSLVPNVGAPTAMTFGGKELSNSLSNVARSVKALGEVSSIVSGSAGLEASFQRRAQDWKFQLKTAEQELKQVQKQIAAATIRVAIAEKDLEIHEKQMEQAAEVHDFYKEKFTSLELYKVMSKELSSMHREAYNVAIGLANQVKAAYEFETGESFPEVLGNWDGSRAGLLAGEGLSLQLQKLESAYLKWNVRQMEIRQSFSMMMLDPQQLLNLRKNGSCDFEIPEWAFDLQYPGYYRRRIVSVQVTIPCIAGPYTNVAATLTMTKGSLKKDAIGSDDTTDVFPYRGSNMVATSNAVNDGGQFDLNFRDERFLPFEGAGAVDSNWKLELPTAFKSFDYNSIADVVFHISYRAKYDGVLKEKTEDELLGKMVSLSRLLSLKQEFPSEFYQLSQPATASDVVIHLTRQHFPYFANAYDIEILSITDKSEQFLVISGITTDPNVCKIKIKHDAQAIKDVQLIIIFKLLSPDPGALPEFVS